MTKRKRNPLCFKEIPLYAKIFQKIFQIPEGFPERLIIAYANAYPAGHIRRISTGNPRHLRSHH